MAINKNHEFEELNGIKCGIVERNVSAERAAFLKSLLEFNQYEVVIVPTPPPKPALKPAAAPDTTPQPEPEATPETFTVGVTDTTFNPINAIFGRMLTAPGGPVVTLAYWQQKEQRSQDDVPYFEKEY